MQPSCSSSSRRYLQKALPAACLHQLFSRSPPTSGPPAVPAALCQWPALFWQISYHLSSGISLASSLLAALLPGLFWLLSHQVSSQLSSSSSLASSLPAALLAALFWQLSPQLSSQLSPKSALALARSQKLSCASSQVDLLTAVLR